MKNYFKGLLSGVAIMVIIFSIPVFAQNIQFAFNEIRISINGVDKVQWGEDFMLDNGMPIPSSILYKDTTYLPLRKIGEYYNKSIYWNGDSRTAAITDMQDYTQQIVAEKPDKNGNVWTYYTFKTNDGRCYLGVKDIQRNYERVYRMTDTTVSVTEEAIYFVKMSEESVTGYRYNLNTNLYKISFLNDENAQDGEIKSELEYIVTGNIVFDGDYLYYLAHIPGNNGQCRLYALNFITGETAYLSSGTWQTVHNLSFVSGNSSRATLEYDIIRSGEPTQSSYEVDVYKDGELRFGEPRKLEEIYTP